MTNSQMQAEMDRAISKFPTDATCWSQGTDEMRYFLETTRGFYNDKETRVSEGQWGYMAPYNFKKVSTPGGYNKKASEETLRLFNSMGKEVKVLYINEIVKPFNDFLEN